jgi:hypothetical protein
MLLIVEKQFPIEGTSLTAVLPTMKYPAPVPAEMQDKPIVPDYYVEWTHQDIKENKDPCMEKVIQLTAGGN